MSSLAVDELRSHLNTFMQMLEAGATTPEIIVAFRKVHAKSIVKARIELEDMGLTKLVNSVGTRRPSKHPGEPDLFSGFGVPNFIVVRDEEGRSVHKLLSKASLYEAKQWAHSPKKPTQPTALQIEVQRLIETIEPYAADDHTMIEIALLASKEHQFERRRLSK